MEAVLSLLFFTIFSPSTRHRTILWRGWEEGGSLASALLCSPFLLWPVGEQARKTPFHSTPLPPSAGRRDGVAGEEPAGEVRPAAQEPLRGGPAPMARRRLRRQEPAPPLPHGRRPRLAPTERAQATIRPGTLPYSTLPYPALPPPTTTVHPHPPPDGGFPPCRRRLSPTTTLLAWCLQRPSRLPHLPPSLFVRPRSLLLS